VLNIPSLCFDWIFEVSPLEFGSFCESSIWNQFHRQNVIYSTNKKLHIYFQLHSLLSASSLPIFYALVTQCHKMTRHMGEGRSKVSVTYYLNGPYALRHTPVRSA